MRQDEHRFEDAILDKMDKLIEAIQALTEETKKANAIKQSWTYSNPFPLSTVAELAGAVDSGNRNPIQTKAYFPQGT